MYLNLYYNDINSTGLCDEFTSAVRSESSSSFLLENSYNHLTSSAFSVILVILITSRRQVTLTARFMSHLLNEGVSLSGNDPSARTLEVRFYFTIDTWSKAPIPIFPPLRSLSIIETQLNKTVSFYRLYQKLGHANHYKSTI